MLYILILCSKHQSSIKRNLQYLSVTASQTFIMASDGQWHGHMHSWLCGSRWSYQWLAVSFYAGNFSTPILL